MQPAPPFAPFDAPVYSDAVPPAAGWRRFATPEVLVRVGIVGLATFLRLFWLDQRPPHFDEGVNGWFTDQMQHQGYYKYDPSNYHGPLHFYVLFLFKCLFGRNLWALRLPVAFVGILTVDWMFRFRAFFGWRTCAWAALAMTLSPGTTFFQRDAIHETWLVFFLVLAFWGICGLWQLGGKRHLWAVALGAAGAILTKETYLVHFACLLVAVPVLWLLEDHLPSARYPLLGPPLPPDPEAGEHTLWNTDDASPRHVERFLATCAPQRYRPQEVLVVLGVCLGLIVFFYSGNFFHWGGLKGLYQAFTFWGKKAGEGEGHNKPFVYWTRLVLQNEALATAGLLACLRWIVPPWPNARFRTAGGVVLTLCLGFVAFEFLAEIPSGGSDPRFSLDAARQAVAHRAHASFGEQDDTFFWALGITTALLLAGAVSLLALPRPADWRLRLLAIYAPGTMLAYSIIPYKTPWCAISFIWPFFFAMAAGLVELTERWTLPAAGWVARGVGVVLAALSTWRLVDLNYWRPTDDKLEYVYVQTFDDFWRITEPLLALARDNPGEHEELHGLILCGSAYPLPWVLGDFTGIGYYSPGAKPPEYRVDFLLVEASRVAEAEGHLDEDYYEETVQLRPAQGDLTLYFRASLFKGYFPADREPEFHPEKPEVPSGVLPPGEHLPPAE